MRSYLLEVLAKCLKNLSEQVHLKYSYFAGISKDFIKILSYYFYYILDFQEQEFLRTLFLTPSGWLV